MFQVVDADATFLEALITEQIAVQRCIGFDAGNRQFGKGYAHFCHGLVAVFTDNADFADQAVVVRRDAIALVDVAVDADAEAAGQVAAFNQARAWNEVVWVFGIDTALKRVAFDLNIFLFVLQRQAGCDA